MITSVRFVVPVGIRDESRPSGGNVYDLELHQALSELGWTSRLLPVEGTWPRPSDEDRRRLADTLDILPSGSTVLLDGLVACGVPEIMEAASKRLRLVILVHLPLADETGLDPVVARELDTAERRSLQCVSAVIATSAHTAAKIASHHNLPANTVHAAVPGVHEESEAALGYGGDLLCVASLTPRKGHPTIITALSGLTDLTWHLRLAGSLEQDPTHVARLRHMIDEAGIADRISLVGTLVGAELDAAYRTTDLLVLPSHEETYGMVLTESLARAVPVYASAVGGVPEAVGKTSGGYPGRLLPPGDSAAWAGALREWLGDADLRDRLKARAQRRRPTLPTWRSTAMTVVGALSDRPADISGRGPRPTVFTAPYPWPPVDVAINKGSGS
ncbi:glycosyltransferase family 4 protein (plasmid) [Streptomyces sp. NBC_01456]|uniref:glycosyltransferase family 4 protein n=1 Tax=unclassified Streptomyces TaxID=2593676 RepID=UPI002E34E4C9|nr:MULTISPECIES: glycosyltransferase family 4 protein [unclassified Streptomyces]